MSVGDAGEYRCDDQASVDAGVHELWQRAQPRVGTGDRASSLRASAASWVINRDVDLKLVVAPAIAGADRSRVRSAGLGDDAETKGPHSASAGAAPLA